MFQKEIRKSREACLLEFCKNRVFMKQTRSDFVRMRKPSQDSKRVDVELATENKIIKNVS